MADITKETLTNTDKGPRGVNTADGAYVEIAPGQSLAVDITGSEKKALETAGYFGFGKSAAAAAVKAQEQGGDAPLPRNVTQLKKIARDEGIEIGDAKTADALQAAIVAGRKAKTTTPTPPPAPTVDLDAMDDNTLKTTVSAITGKPVADLPDDRAELLKLARGE